MHDVHTAYVFCWHERTCIDAKCLHTYVCTMFHVFLDGGVGGYAGKKSSFFLCIKNETAASKERNWERKKKSEKGIPESGGICRWRARELRSASTACPHAQRHASSPCRCRPNSAVACGPRSGRRGVFKNRRRRRRRADLQ